MKEVILITGSSRGIGAATAQLAARQGYAVCINYVRNALVTKACVDPAFKNEVDAKCLASVQSREHWWQHLGYAMTHFRP